MKASRTSLDDLRMKDSEFDKIMRRALQVHPEPAAPAKKRARRPAAHKKSRKAK